MSLRWRPTGALISLLALSAAVTTAALLAWALPIPRWGAALLAFAAIALLLGRWQQRCEQRTQQRIATASMASLQEILNHIPEPAFIKDAHGRFTLINEAFARQRGLPIAALVGKTAAEILLTDENAQAIADEDQRILAGEKVLREESFVSPVDGRQIHRIISKERAWNPQGEAIIVGASFNITGLRLAELELRAALAKQAQLLDYFQRLLDALPTPVFVRNAQGCFVMSNRALNDLFGRPPAEILGKTFGELTGPAFAEPDEAEEAALIRGEIASIRDREAVLSDAHGQLRQLIVRKVLGQDVDQQPVIIGTLSDITALRRTEARWKFALEGAGDGVWDWNIQANITYYSPRWKRMLGYTDHDIGDSPEERIRRIHPEDIESAMAALQAHLDGRSPVYFAEYRLRRQDERYVWVLDRGQIMERDRLGRPMRMIATYSDITQRKSFEDELRRHRNQLQDLVQEQTASLLRAKTKAEDASAAKTSFLSNMTHELRTPMHAVLSFARLGEDRALEAPAHKLRDYFERIRTSGERLMLLLNDLLDLAKLEAGRMDLALQRVRLRVVTQEALHEFEAAFAAKRLRLDTALDDDGVVVGDPMRLGQVVRNLISNAVKFSPEGGTLRLSVAATELQVHSRGEELPHMPAMELRVADDGLGIPPAELDTIFESFTQSSQTKSSAGGTGLGLSICKEIVMAHGGIIYARNRDGGGAEFVVCIPSPLR